MTDRKQEAIIILSNMYRCPDDPISDEAQVSWAAERLYDRLAALREYPGEEYAAIIAEAWQRGRETEGLLSWESIKDLREKAKLLWHGQEPKGGCPKCGGKGEFWSHGSATQCSCSTPSYTHKCPACNGTGDRRQGEQRKAIERRGYDSSLSSAGSTPEGPYGRRDGEERRKTSGDESRPTKEDK